MVRLSSCALVRARAWVRVFGCEGARRDSGGESRATGGSLGAGVAPLLSLSLSLSLHTLLKGARASRGRLLTPPVAAGLALAPLVSFFRRAGGGTRAGAARVRELTRALLRTSSTTIAESSSAVLPTLVASSVPTVSGVTDPLPVRTTLWHAEDPLADARGSLVVASTTPPPSQLIEGSGVSRATGPALPTDASEERTTNPSSESSSLLKGVRPRTRAERRLDRGREARLRLPPRDSSSLEAKMRFLFRVGRHWAERRLSAFAAEAPLETSLLRTSRRLRQAEAGRS